MKRERIALGVSGALVVSGFLASMKKENFKKEMVNM